MNIEQLKIKLVKHGNIEIIKEGFVFTLLMTGPEMSKWNVVADIQKMVLEYASKKYPFIEAMRNTENYFCMILKP